MTTPQDPISADAITALLTTAQLGRELVYLDECDSTNRVALERAAQGAGHGLAVVADRQTAGRGRLDRVWHSPAGRGIYLSIVLRPDISPEDAPPLTLTCAVAVAEAIAEVAGVAARVKWPNDLLVAGRKVCGILLEMNAVPGRLAYVVAGIGINVHPGSFPDDVAGLATSLQEHANQPLSRAVIVAAVLGCIEQRTAELAEEGFSAIRPRWRELAAHLDLPVAVAQPGDAPLEGITAGIADDGALLVRDASGAERRIVAGDIWDPQRSWYVGDQRSSTDG